MSGTVVVRQGCMARCIRWKCGILSQLWICLPSLVLLVRPVVGEQQRQHEVGGRGLAQRGHQLQPARGPAVAQQDLDTRREAARRHWAHSWIK